MFYLICPVSNLPFIFSSIYILYIYTCMRNVLLILYANKEILYLCIALRALLFREFLQIGVGNVLYTIRGWLTKWDAEEEIAENKIFFRCFLIHGNKKKF